MDEESCSNDVLGQVRDKLKYLYPDKDSKFIFESLKGIMDGYLNNPNIVSKREKYEGRFKLTESDAIVITYADSIKHKGERPLKTLYHFMKEHLKGSVSGVHILPFFLYSSDDGFSVIDYKEVDPLFGDWDDIERIGEDYRLMADLVINHISKESRWFKKFLEGDEKYRDYFIYFDDEKVDVSSVFRPRTSPLLVPFDTAFGKKYVWTTFSDDQIDLNFKNPDVLLDMIEIMLFYLSKKIEIIRLDAVGYLWKELGSACIHLNQTHEIVKLLRLVLSYVAPYAIIITETNVQYLENISYFGNGLDESHMVYQFSFPPLVFDAFLRNDTTYLQKKFKMLSELHLNSVFFNFLASHDGIGVTSAKGFLPDEHFSNLVKGTKEHGGLVSYKAIWGKEKQPYELNINYFDAVNNPNENTPLDMEVKKFIASQAVMLFSRGVPGIYINSLLGARNYTEGVEKTGINRRINREKFYLENIEEELKNPDSIRHKVLRNYLRLLDTRKKMPLLSPYIEEQIIGSDSRLLIFTRRDNHTSEIVVIINISADEIFFEQYIGKRDLVSEKDFDGRIEPFFIYCLKVK